MTNCNNGYKSIVIDHQTYYIHRVVAEVFDIGDIEGLCVNHKDGEKSNNAVANLELVTYSENHKHAFKTLGRTAWHRGKDLGGGVCFDKSRNKWMAYGDYLGKRIYLGRFESQQEAQDIHDKWRTNDDRSAC